MTSVASVAELWRFSGAHGCSRGVVRGPRLPRDAFSRLAMWQIRGVPQTGRMERDHRWRLADGGIPTSEKTISFPPSDGVDAQSRVGVEVTETLWNPPAAWTNQPIRIYHGTTDVHADAILQAGVRISNGQLRRDFGPGFYTTTLREQAEHWAWELSSRSADAAPAVLELTLDRDALGELETLAFVRGEREAEDFWSLVTHCRAGAADHVRRGDEARYDVVIGPVAAFWKQRVAMLGADQISFHTQRAQRLLNSAGTDWRRIW